MLFAPGSKHGEVYAFVSPPVVRRRGFSEKLFYESHKWDAFVYLAPGIERLSQARVDSVVAHEFAHVILGHGSPDGRAIHDAVPTKQADVPAEGEADRLVRLWGFDPAYPEHRNKKRKQR
jgi:hypothetical protein